MNFLSKYQPQLLSALRIVAGLLFLEHGTAKLLHFPHFAMYDHLPTIAMVAGVIELVGGALLVIGLFTRIVAFVCSGEMAIAYWLVHFGGSHVFWPLLNQGELAILYCFAFLYLAAAGPGPWSIDGARSP